MTDIQLLELGVIALAVVLGGALIWRGASAIRRRDRVETPDQRRERVEDEAW